MIATLTFETVSSLDKQYIKRIGVFLALIDKLKKSRLSFVKASQNSDDKNSSSFLFALAKERIAFIIQLQNQIQKFDKRIQELAFKSYFEKEDIESSEEASRLNSIETSQEINLIDAYRKSIQELPLPTKIESLLCHQLNTIENYVNRLHL